MVEFARPAVPFLRVSPLPPFASVKFLDIGRGAMPLLTELENIFWGAEFYKDGAPNGAGADRQAGMRSEN